jgi:hypothetical protein
MLQFFSASTSIVNSRRAITKCIENALEGEPNLDCDLIIIYTAMGHNFKELLSEARKLSPGAQIAGCSGMGVIGREGPNETLKALAIMVIKGPKNEFAIASTASLVNKDLFEVSARLATDLRNKNPEINMIHFLPSGIDIYPAYRLIEGIESVFGPEVPVFGGAATDNMKGLSCFQFHNDQVLERGAVMIGFADPSLMIFSQASHGMNVLEGLSFEVTKSELNRIIELNGQPAWKLLTKTLGVPETTPVYEILFLAMLACKIPEEYHKDLGYNYSMNPMFRNPESNDIIYMKDIKEGTKLFLAKRNEELMFKGVDQTAQRIAKHLTHKKVVAVFHADCLIRGRLSINRVLKEEIVGRMQYPICDDQKIPWLGLYSGGEFAMIGGKNWAHGFTTTICALYRNHS